jgi:hypothetical protein
MRRRLFRGRWRRSVLAAAVACGTAAALVTAASVAVAPAAAASGPPGDSGAYSRASTASEDHSDWLASVNGSTPIWQLSIPGTHDSYTATLSKFGPSYQTQTMSVAEQLKMGIRGLDVRLEACSYFADTVCKDDRNDFLVEHGGIGVSNYTTLGAVLDQLRTFLSAHRSEFVILRAEVEKEGDNFTANFNAVLNKYSNILWRGNANASFMDPTLSQVRGKVVLLKQFDGGTSATINDYGMKYGADGFVIQDDWKMVTNWSLYSKWEKVRDNWLAAVAYAKTGGTSRGYINFLTGNYGSFPYFVASGYDSENGLPLATGYTSITGPNKYPDFHWVSCFLGSCTVAFTGTNILMYDVLSGQNRAGDHWPGLRGQRGMGLIYIDFPGQPLVNSIIASNPGAGPTGRIVSGLNTAKCVDVNDGIGKNGTKVQMWDCGGYLPAQQWTMNANGTITAGGGCLDIYGAAYTDGTNITWNTCNGGANQQWRMENGQLVNPVSNKCLDDPAANTANGTQLKLYGCNGGSWQQWRLSTRPEGTIVSGVSSSKCVDLDHNNRSNGTKVQMWDCNGTSAQAWILNSYGTITLGGGCLDIYGAKYVNDTKIAWNVCNGGLNQQWQAVNGELVNPHSGKCLDDPGGNTKNGTQLILYTCNSGANQRWSLPSSA